MEKLKRISQNKWVRRGAGLGALAFSMGFAAWFIYQLSVSTSMKWAGFCGNDSAVFQLVGRAWSQGMTPYSQVFDHKGPLIFFIDAVGYLLHGRAGILVLQTLSLTAAIFFFYKLSRVFLNIPLSVLSVAAGLLYTARTFEEGNMTEEYSLPFIALSLWLLLRWCKQVQQNGPQDHPWQWALVYGGCFGAIFMLRVTSAVSFCGFIAVVCIFLMIWKRWKNLGQNALGFLGGFGLAFGPFALYFAVKGAFGDMMYGTLWFNIKYAGGISLMDYYRNHPYPQVIHDILWGELFPILIAFSLVTLVMLLLKPKEPLGWGLLICLALNGYLMFSNRPYVHYFMILAPLVCLGAAVCGNVWQLRKAGWLHQAAAFLLAAGALYYGWFLWQWTEDWEKSVEERYVYEALDYGNIARSMAAVIPAEEWDDVLCYEVDAQWYLATSVLPARRFCIHQDWQKHSDPAMAQEILETMQNDPPKWLVCSLQVDPEIRQIVDEKYEAVSGETTFYHYGNYQLYRLK